MQIGFLLKEFALTYTHLFEKNEAYYYEKTFTPHGCACGECVCCAVAE